MLFIIIVVVGRLWSNRVVDVVCRRVSTGKEVRARERRTASRRRRALVRVRAYCAARVLRVRVPENAVAAAARKWRHRRRRHATTNPGKRRRTTNIRRES